MPAGLTLSMLMLADSDDEGVKEGWEKYYWKPWRKYLLWAR